MEPTILEGGLGADVENAAESVAPDTAVAGSDGKAAESPSKSAGEKPDGESGATWIDALPENVRAAAEKAGSMEALTKALERGLAYVPVASADEITVTAPEGFELNDANTAWFKELAVEHGFTKAQADALISRYGEVVKESAAAQYRETIKNLKSEYGGEFTEKMAVAEDGMKKLDELSGGALGSVIKMGLGNHEDFIKAMVVIGENISDSILPGTPQGGGNGGEAVTTEQYFKTEVFGGK